jgi:hypothetical protein
MRARVVVLALFSLACAEARAGIEVVSKGETLYRCDDAAVSELSPKAGGWAFKCGDGSSVYFVYETNETAAKGTIERITINFGADSKREALELYAIADPEADPSECPNARSDRGPEPLPTRLGRVAAGTHVLELARPCEQLEVRVR